MRRLAFALLLATLAAPTRGAADAVASLTVPIVISTSGLAGSFYTSELTLTNRGTTPATLRFTYTAAFGGGGGTGTDTLAAARQKTVPDAIEYLISIGVPIPATGNRGGVVRVDFSGLSSPDAGTVTVRTTSAVTNGRAGLAYAAVRSGLGGASYLCGLRQNAADRSNVALLNAGAAGAGDVVLRLTVFSGDPAAPATRVLPDVRLAPGAFTQFTEILKTVGLEKGWVRVEPVAGSATYYAYATILDQTTSDGSFVPPLGEAAVYTPGGATLPVVVETSAFSTEVVVTNVADQPVTVRLAYVADEVHTADSTATVELALAAREQRVIPAFVAFLRSQAAAGVGGLGPTFAGALTMRVVGDPDVGGVFLGGRTQTTAPGGKYGLFYTAIPHGEAATDTAWLYGLQQNAENRANLALVNTGEADGSAAGLKVEIFDGASGALAKAFDVSLPARRWTQVNSVLSGTGVANGYARVTRTSGANPFLAYAVVVDGGTPQARSDDGAFVIADVEEPPPSAELAAIRKVEAKAAELLAAQTSGLDFARAVNAYMETLPEYQVTGVDDVTLTAYGMFANGRLHLVAANREADATGAGVLPASRLRPLVTELPRSGFARLAQSFGETRFTAEPVDDLAAVFKDPGGYAIQPGRNGDARLSVLRTISGDGFFYFNTHGGRAFMTKDKSGPGFFSMQSSTIVTPVTERFAEIIADFQAKRLTYQTEPNFQQAYDPRLGRMVDLVDTRYGITSQFVKDYWSFEPFSILFFNVCWSGYTGDPEGAAAFINACLAKKAGVYFGWSKQANSGTCFDTVRYFVDRVIGASQFMKESPDQRAFPWELVYDDMQKHHPNLTHDSRTGADLVAYAQSGSIVLDPSIEKLLVNEYDGSLMLKGYFGTVQGKVFVETTELHVRTWGADTIVADLPLKDAGSKGAVHVEVAGAPGKMRKSNVRQLAEWDVPVQYTWNDVFGTTGWKITGTGTFRFRGDVGGTRQKPGTTPQFPIRGMFPTKDSTFQWVASGSHTDSCTSTLSGSASLGTQTTGNVSFFILAALEIDAKAPQTGTLGLAYGAISGGSPFTITISGGPNCSGTFPLPPTFGELEGPHEFLQPTESGPNVPAFSLNVVVDGTFRIALKHFVELRLQGQLTIDAGPAQPAPAIKTDLPQ